MTQEQMKAAIHTELKQWAELNNMKGMKAE